MYPSHLQSSGSTNRNRTVMIDGRNLDLERGTGVATYARNLSYCIRDLGYKVDVLYGSRPSPKMKPLMKEISFFDAHSPPVSPLARAWRDMRNAVGVRFGFSATRVPMSGAVICDAFSSRLPYFDGIQNSPSLFSIAHANFSHSKPLRPVHPAERPDLMHWTYPLPLRVRRAPNIYTLHDLVPLRLPHTTLDNKRNYFRLISAICAQADHIVTVSESSKADIVSMFGIDPSRVSNTYQSVFIPGEYIERDADTLARQIDDIFGLTYKDYYIFWGAIEPKKNIGRLIEGYLASGVSAPLVVVGAQAWKAENELKLLNDLRAGGRAKKKIIQLNYVPFSLLMTLVKGARGAVFPSLYEGFGLPVLEAMLLGTPVISSTTASLPEVAGDACLLVNPYKTSEIARALATLDADTDLQAELSQRGLRQAQLFSQTAHMARLRQVYDKLL
jgi:glycosyltransferase involved in cell wall biosynthesis